LAESDDAGNTLTEYVWFDDMPIALVANVDTSPSLYFVHTDHLDRPIMMTDANKSIVWQADYNPFGGVNSITGSATNNLRFPGQYFLMEDGLHYNWYRHYDPTIGRYVQPDPLGFINGPSIYAYAESNPLAEIDPEGLQTPPPPSNIPGGPWTWYPDPQNSRGGTFQDPNGNSANWDPEGHWDVWDRQGNRQRYNRHGAPISPDEAHRPYKGPPRLPFPRFFFEVCPIPLMLDPCYLFPDSCFPGQS
jgi:RHS repeat-associated protein